MYWLRLQMKWGYEEEEEKESRQELTYRSSQLIN
jgi:hypothetical protein